jgi:hypothetical protein
MLGCSLAPRFPSCQRPIAKKTRGRDLLQLAQAALLIGRETKGVDHMARAHQAFLNRGEVQPAARCAFWLGFTLLIAGESAKAGGWLSRAGRMLDSQPDCVEKGFLLLPEGYRAFHAGDLQAARLCSFKQSRLESVSATGNCSRSACRDKAAL